MSDQDSEPAEDAPVQLEEKLRLVSKATQTIGDAADVVEAVKHGEVESGKVEDESTHVQITASLSEVIVPVYVVLGFTLYDLSLLNYGN